MMLIEKIQNVFPRASDIPPPLLEDIPSIQTGYLVDGEIRIWDGPRQEVLAPVRVAGGTGPKPLCVGEYALLTEAQALQALDAAVAAYDHGRGLWPTLPVAARIDHMQRFVFRMIEERARVVRFLMWEVGKSLQDSEKEFDRDVFPKGVINVIYGEGRRVIPPLMASGKINVLALIGTSKTANALKKLQPSPNRLRCVLGLEAKNPAIVLKGADLDLAIKECVLGSLSFNGQRCTALKILFVEAAIADAFLERFAAAVNALSFGMPWHEGVFVTPVAEKGKTDYLRELVSDAVAHGARAVNPAGGTVCGSFFFPAILYPVHHNMRVYHEEQFGPVIPVLSFDQIAEPIAYMINSNYGQQVSIFRSDPEQIARLIDPLVNQVCRVNINSQCQRGPDTFPFTGRKDSAEGTLSVSDALRVFFHSHAGCRQANGSEQADHHPHRAGS
ncbi:MAG: aldehyde dehydrogenase family protein [Desulfobacterales bacterium]